MQAMDESYRLVFRGEVLDNQHPAVVKKRLIAALKLTDAQGERLFSGASVVLKQSADTKTAARFQGLFRQAGARLRVLPVAPEDAVPEASAKAQSAEPAVTGELGVAPSDSQVGLAEHHLGVVEQHREERPALDHLAKRVGVAADAPLEGVAVEEPQLPAAIRRHEAAELAVRRPTNL